MKRCDVDVGHPFYQHVQKHELVGLILMSEHIANGVFPISPTTLPLFQVDHQVGDLVFEAHRLDLAWVQTIVHYAMIIIAVGCHPV
jgi:hypothetical protein